MPQASADIWVHFQTHAGLFLGLMRGIVVCPAGQAPNSGWASIICERHGTWNWKELRLEVSLLTVKMIISGGSYPPYTHAHTEKEIWKVNLSENDHFKLI